MPQKALEEDVMKAVLFGAGEIGQRILKKGKHDVMAVIDNNTEMLHILG